MDLLPFHREAYTTLLGKRQSLARNKVYVLFFFLFVFDCSRRARHDTERVWVRVNEWMSICCWFDGTVAFNWKDVLFCHTFWECEWNVRNVCRRICRAEIPVGKSQLEITLAAENHSFTGSVNWNCSASPNFPTQIAHNSRFTDSLAAGLNSHASI